MAKISKPLLIIVSTVLILGVGGIVLADKANAATPEDTLFPVDKFFESATRVVMLNPTSLIEFEQQVLDERLEELAAATDTSDIALYVTEVEAQEEKLDTAIDESGDTLSAEEKEQIRNQYQEKIQAHIETMEQVQTKLGNENAKESLGKAIENFEGKLTASQNEEAEANSEKNSGEDTQIQNQNQESNTDNSNSSGNGSSGSNGNGNN